jgi:uncharacterized SAM-binding protein YcdF (DUF218 family)
LIVRLKRIGGRHAPAGRADRVAPAAPPAAPPAAEAPAGPAAGASPGPPSLAADAIVVLGTAVSESGRPSPGLRARMARALALYDRDAAPFMLLTGGGNGTPPEAEVMRRLALAHGVPDSALVLEPTARTTFENAARSAAILRERGWRRAILVTSWPHLPRALLAFRAAGVRAVGRAAPAAATPVPFRRTWHYLAYEAAALAWYAAVLTAGRMRVRRCFEAGGRNPPRQPAEDASEPVRRTDRPNN